MRSSARAGPITIESETKKYPPREQILHGQLNACGVDEETRYRGRLLFSPKLLYSPLSSDRRRSEATKHRPHIFARHISDCSRACVDRRMRLLYRVSHMNICCSSYQRISA